MTLFVSAILLFTVEPMIGKVMLPKLGGTPAVWNTCMVFFQAALLLGYAYSHLLTRWLSLRRQLMLHTALIFCPLFFLPFQIGEGAFTAVPAEDNPVLWLIGFLVINMGLPFIFVCTSAPPEVVLPYGAPRRP